MNFKSQGFVKTQVTISFWFLQTGDYNYSQGFGVTKVNFESQGFVKTQVTGSFWFL